MLLPGSHDFLFWHGPRFAVCIPHSYIIVIIYFNDRYKLALADQPRTPMLPEPYATRLPVALFLTGQLFVITSTWALGITGTFLGDYFGILMDHRVEGFPFNVLRDPMYVGSTMCFAATALWYESPAGLCITLYVYIVYIIALRFEGYVLHIYFFWSPVSLTWQSIHGCYLLKTCVRRTCLVQEGLVKNTISRP